MRLVQATSSAPPRSAREDAKSEGFGYRTYGSFAEAGCLKQEWNDLASRAGDIHCSFDWCEVWWKYFSTDRRLEIHALHDGPRLVAVLPLFREVIRPGGVWLRTVRVLGCDYTTGTIGLAVEPAYAERFAGMLLGRLSQAGPWDILQIAGLRSYATVVEPITQACAGSSHVQTVIAGRQDAWLTMFHLPRTYEGFLASLSSKVRSDTRRRERRLTESHEVEICEAEAPEEVGPAMDALIRLHQKRWTGRGKPGQLRDPSVQQFHRELARRLAEKGQLVLLTLKVDGQILSVGYGYRFGGRTHSLMVGHSYDEPWQEYGLGRIMHCHLICHAIEHGSCELEDGRGVFDYKLRLGGELHGEPSLVVVHKGWSTRLRVWAGLRMAYLVHLLYSRLWVDMIAPHLRVHPEGRRLYFRTIPWARLYQAVGFRLWGGPAVLERPRSPLDAASETGTRQSNVEQDDMPARAPRASPSSD